MLPFRKIAHWTRLGILMTRLDGKLALITGGSTGIGYSTAKSFLDEGASVCITGQHQERLDTATASLGKKTIGRKTDQTNMAEIDSLIEFLGNEFGRVDTVFLNAGITLPCPVESVTEEQFDHLYRTNVKGPFFTLQKLIPLLSGTATVVINASNLAGLGVPNTSTYSATKASLISMTRTFGVELLPKGIRVNAVAPGPIATPSMSKLGMSEEELQGLMQMLEGTIPMGRIGTAEEIAKAVLFLATADSSYMVGETITLDGGWSSF